MTANPEGSEARRLEKLWSGEFGDQYVERNAAAGSGRAPFWTEILERTRARSVLEVGCNVGANLQHIVGDGRDVWGVDVNAGAIEALHTRLPNVSAGWAVARNLPFRDRWFDLVFTIAVLIHQPEDTLAIAMAELVRCSGRHILAVEYDAPSTTAVNYRGIEGAFFKRDYGQLFPQLFPELSVVTSGQLTKDGGFDDGLGYWLLERTNA